MSKKQFPTHAQRQALRAIAQCGTIKDAAKWLGVSPHTLDSRLDQLRRKTGLRYLPQLVAWGAQYGCLPPEIPPAPAVTLRAES